MSHFTAIVIMPSTTEDVEKYLEDILSPYDENRQVRPYQRKCHCIGWEVRKKARERFWGDLQEKRKENPELETDQEWDRFIEMEKRNQEEKEFLSAHPLKDTPNPTCEDCKGTGSYLSSYNPDSKWDWYQIGGRWAGDLAGEDPTKNPRNYETCFICSGTGKREDELGKEMRLQNPEYTCNGCNGTGRSLKHASQWITSSAGANEQSIKVILEMFYVPYALVTPDGEWLEKGEMGWFGCSSNEMPPQDWEERVRQVYRRYEADVWKGVLVDLHI